MTTNFRHFLALLLICVAVAARISAYAQSPSPASLSDYQTVQITGQKLSPAMVLRGAFDPRLTTDAIMIQTVRERPDSDTPTKVKVELSKSGKIRNTIIEPLVMQGISYIDDGRTVTQYRPEDEVMVIYPSPQLGELQVDEKLKLIERNYTLSEQKSEKVAGRSTFVIKAAPKQKGMPTRFYWIERTHFTILRSAVDFPKTKRWVQIDTYSVQYGPKLCPKLFGPEDIEDWGVRRVDAPRDYPTFQAASKATRLALNSPANIPFGFSLQTVKVWKVDNYPLVSAWLTDGLVLVRMLIHKSAFNIGSLSGDAALREESGGITFELMSELPRALNIQFMKAFKAR